MHPANTLCHGANPRQQHELDKQLRLNALALGASFRLLLQCRSESAGIVPQVSLSLPAL